MTCFFALDAEQAWALIGYMFAAAVILKYAREQWNRIGSIGSCLLGIYIFSLWSFPVENNWFLFSYLSKLLISFSIKIDSG